VAGAGDGTPLIGGAGDGTPLIGGAGDGTPVTGGAGDGTPLTAGAGDGTPLTGIWFEPAVLAALPLLRPRLAFAVAPIGSIFPAR
jgi:hypothetical protein